MALAITDEHEALAEVVRDFASANRLRGWARGALDAGAAPVPDAWQQIAELGWLGLHLPEAAGGSGFAFAELAVVLDEFGHALGPGMLLANAVASSTLARVDTQGHATTLRALADGSLLVGIAATSALRRGAGDMVSGEAVVLAGSWAQSLLLIVDADLVILPVDTSGVTLTPVAGLDPSLGLAQLSLESVRLDATDVVPGAASVASRFLRLVLAIDAAGGARACLDLALEYAKVREQFGRIIGSFQAVKHHLANMLVEVELATALAWDAARGAEDDAEADLAAAAAASRAPAAYLECAHKLIQILGGIGFTWEHDAHLYLRRAGALRAVLEASGNAEDVVAALTAANVRRGFGVDLPPEADAYRADAREFRESLEAADAEKRRVALVESGYLVPHWPPPFGRGAGAVEQLVIEQEFAGMEVPSLGIGGWVLLTLSQTATPEQIARWMEPSLRGDLQWCQLFSEPGAGSDAAAVQTRATRVEGGWRVTGQKVWTSGAQDCNRGLATVRTDRTAPKHKGITAMVIDLDADGVSIRPLREITGHALFNEVFLDDVYVPDDDVVGSVNDGWRVARTTLGNERVTIGGGSREGLSALALGGIAARQGETGQEATRAIARLVVEEQGMRCVNLRQATRALVGAGPGPEGNVTKLLSAEHAQRVSECALRLGGVAAVAERLPEVTHEYLFDRCLTIAGGTSEISRNVIAERILGLPREPVNR